MGKDENAWEIWQSKRFGNEVIVVHHDEDKFLERDREYHFIARVDERGMAEAIKKDVIEMFQMYGLWA